MQIKLWKNFSKRANSTKIPTTAPDAILDVHLKEKTSQESPTFLIDSIDWDWTYVEWNGHYYFVSDKIVSTRNVFELVCRQDALASHKNDVLSTTAFIKYASNSTVDGFQFNNMIYDSRIGQYVSRTQKLTESEQILNATVNYYVLTIINNQSTMVSYYLLNSAQLQQFSNFLFTENFWQQLILEFNDAINSIISIKALPITPAMYDAMVEQQLFIVASPVIYVGKFPMIDAEGNTCRAIGRFKTDAVLTYGITPVIIPWNYSDFRRIDEQIRLYLPMIGIIDIPSASLLDANRLLVHYKLNPTLCRISYEIRTARIDEEGPLEDGFIAEYTTDYGYDIPLKAYNTQIISGITGLMADIPSAMTKAVNPTSWGDMLGDVAAIGGDMFKLVDNAPTVIGSIGDATVMKKPLKVLIYLIGRNYIIEPSNLWATQGRPVEAVDVVGNYSGYVQTVNASVSGSMNEGDRNEINNLLNGGIYVE